MAAWNDGNLKPFDQILNNIYDNDFNPFQDMEMNTRCSAQQSPRNGSSSSKSNIQDRKKRLTNEQLDSLEKSFQEEIKLEPERKMKLAQELELQPRQVAVWFQNRRARWKVKQIERLYDSLKKEFDLVTRENQKLQAEVMKLKVKLEDRGAGSMSYTEAGSAADSVESKSAVFGNTTKLQASNFHQISANHCNYVFNSMDGYDPTSSPYLAVLPNCHP
ncbi:hypothetical protein ACHQM5_020198 [Ranunculus cassubicifolius]